VLLWRLETLGERRGLIVDQVGFDLLVLGEKRLQVNHEVFDHPKCQQWHDGDLVRQTPHQELAGEAIEPIHAHGIRPADPVSARPAKGEGAVLFPLDLVERVQQAIICFNIHPVLGPIGSPIFLRIKASNLECDSLHHPSCASLTPLALLSLLFPWLCCGAGSMK
jgi:hypothetical protein